LIEQENLFARHVLQIFQQPGDQPFVRRGARDIREENANFRPGLDLNERAWRLANSVINALLIVTGVIVVLAVVFAGPLVGLYASNYSEVPGKLELTIYLARIVTPFLTLVAIAAVLMGMLNSLGHFFVPALSPAMFNVAGIAMAVTLIPFAPRLGVQPITIVAVATLVGGLAQLAIQWPPLSKEGFRYRPTLDLKDEPPAGAVADGTGHDRDGRDADQCS
jgi:peptidoglycan biosynthesis protein MviN/MurJ (putative lipid II flippase)